MSNIEKLQDRIKNLEDLLILKQSANTAYSEAIKEVSEECEVKTTVLRKLIAARIADSTEQEIENTEELLALFEQTA